jgi:hypothetical protein
MFWEEAKLLAKENKRKIFFQILKLGRAASAKRNKKIFNFKYSNLKKAKLLAKKKRNKKIFNFQI